MLDFYIGRVFNEAEVLWEFGVCASRPIFVSDYSGPAA